MAGGVYFCDQPLTRLTFEPEADRSAVVGTGYRVSGVHARRRRAREADVGGREPDKSVAERTAGELAAILREHIRLAADRCAATGREPVSFDGFAEQAPESFHVRARVVGLVGGENRDDRGCAGLRAG